jgi:hypothetical protein
VLSIKVRHEPLQTSLLSRPFLLLIVYGMGIDLVTVLAVMGTVGVGNPLALNPGFSIGGKSWKSNNLLGNLLGLLGTPRGLDGAHNWIESDSSNTCTSLETHPP